MMLRTLRSVLVAALATASAGAAACEFYTKNLTIIHPWANATPPETWEADVYLKFESILADDKLIGASSSIATTVVLQGAGKSPAPTTLTLPAGAIVELNADGVHLRMQDLQMPLQWGPSYPLTLVFERAGEVQMMVSVGAH